MCKKRFAKKIRAFSFAAAALFAAGLFASWGFLSCSNFSGDVSSENILAPVSDGTKGGLESQENSRSLTASVKIQNLPKIPTGSAARTGADKRDGQGEGASKSAFPDISVVTSDAAYTISAELQAPGGGSYSADGIYDSDASAYSFAFGGAYSESAQDFVLAIKLYYTDSASPAVKSLVASGSKSVTVVAGSHSLSASVQLKPNTESSIKGSLELPVKIAGGAASSANLSLIDSTGTDVAATYLLDGNFLSLASGEGTIKSVAVGIPSGTYTLLMTFKNAGGAVVGSRTESLNIYPSLKTSAWWTNGGGAESQLNMTAFVQTEYYVRGTGGAFYTTIFPGAKAASDSNTGSFVEPLASIQAAVDRIAASGDTTSQFTVYIDGKIAGDPDADYSASQNSLVSVGISSSAGENKILFKGWTGPETDIIDVQKSQSSANGGRAFYINSSAKITVQNLWIKNAAVASPSNGGAFFILGLASDTSIENCKISGCNSEKGGAIYLSQGSLALKNVEVTENKSQDSGGGIYVDADGSLEINGGTISENVSDKHGGGVYNSGSLVILDGEISNNKVSGAVDSYQYGGGVYNSSGATCQISGGAISANQSNRYGGGIYNTGTLTFTDGTISGNLLPGAANHTLGGAGVYTSGTFTMEGGEISGHENSTTYSGAVMIGSGGIFNMKGGRISNNNTKGSCAAVFVYAANAIFNMNGGTMENNYATGSVANSYIRGGAVYVAGGTFSMSGAASIPPGDSSGNTGNGYNDVYLSTVKTIQVSYPLSAPLPVAAIRPSSYAVGTQLVTLASGSSAVLAAEAPKFEVVDDGSETGWFVGADGKLQKPSVCYVAAATASPAGNDDTGNGTKAAPYATISKAAQSFAANPEPAGSADEPVFENKIYVLSDLTYTSGAGATGDCKFELVGCKGGTVGSPVTLTFNTPSDSGFYVASGQKIKFTNINITQSSAAANNYAAILVENTGSGSGEFWMEDCSIKNIYANNCSAIAAKGDVHLKNVEISGNKTVANTSGDTPFGPAVHSTTGTVSVLGKVVITDNQMEITSGSEKVYKDMNLWIGENSGTPVFHPIAIAGAMDSESEIGVSLFDCSSAYSQFTSGFALSGISEPSSIFASDDGMSVQKSAGEAVMKAPTDFYVSLTGSDLTGSGSSAAPYETIEKAVKKINSYDDSGTEYTIHIEGSPKAQALVLDSSETLGPKVVASKLNIVGTGASASILSGNGSDSILALVDIDVPIVIENIGFLNGKAATGSGGAIDADNAASLTIKNCVFANCSSTAGNGGAIYLAGATNCRIDGCRFTDNSAKNGGAIYVGGGSSISFVNDSSITRSTAESAGGGLYAANTSTVDLNGVTVAGNSAKFGGGIMNLGSCFIYGDTVIGDSSALTAPSSTPDSSSMSNSATSYGGAIYNSNGSIYLGYSAWTSESVYALKELTGGIYANYSDGHGAGIYSPTGTIKMASGNIRFNGLPSGAHQGAGVFVKGSFEMSGGLVDSNKCDMGAGINVDSATGSFKMSGGTISNNVSSASSGGGGGILVSNGASFVMDDGLIEKNSAARGGGIWNWDSSATINGGSISQNSGTYGGGICVYTSDFTSSIVSEVSMTGGEIVSNSGIGAPNSYGAGVYIERNAKFSMSGGTISENEAIYGGAVYTNFDSESAASWGTFELSGSSYIPAGVSGAMGGGKNDIQITMPLTVSGTLTHSAPAATITPGGYIAGLQVLGGTAALISANYTKFALAPDPDGGEWYINSSGLLCQSVSTSSSGMADYLSSLPSGSEATIKIDDVTASNITSIRDALMANSDKIVFLDFSDSSLDSLPASSFYNMTSFTGCTNLVGIELPDGLTSIGMSAFMGCTSLESIEIPDGVTGIGVSAFYGCSSLTEIEIPASVTSIGMGAFAGSGLTSAEFEEKSGVSPTFNVISATPSINTTVDTSATNSATLANYLKTYYTTATWTRQ